VVQERRAAAPGAGSAQLRMALARKGSRTRTRGGPRESRLSPFFSPPCVQEALDFVQPLSLQHLFWLSRQEQSVRDRSASRESQTSAIKRLRHSAKRAPPHREARLSASASTVAGRVRTPALRRLPAPRGCETLAPGISRSQLGSGRCRTIQQMEGRGAVAASPSHTRGTTGFSQSWLSSSPAAPVLKASGRVKCTPFHVT